MERCLDLQFGSHIAVNSNMESISAEFWSKKISSILEINVISKNTKSLLLCRNLRIFSVGPISVTLR